MSAEQESSESIVEVAYKWARAREGSVRSQLNREVLDRMWGQTYNPEKLEDLHQKLEEDGIAVNRGLVKNAAREAYSDAVNQFKTTLDEFYESFEEEVADFAKSVYEQEEDMERTLEILEKAATNVVNNEPVPYEIVSIDGYKEFQELIVEEKRTSSKINNANPPSVETLREEYYPEIPTEAYENFRRIFGSEGTIDVTKQAELQDFN